MPDENPAHLITSEKELDTEALVREHIDWILALTEQILRDRGQAEDAVQDAFIAAFRGLDRGAV